MCGRLQEVGHLEANVLGLMQEGCQCISHMDKLWTNVHNTQGYSNQRNQKQERQDLGIC